VIGFLPQRSFLHGTPLADQPTWIIFASNHGEVLGDNHLFRKVLPYLGSIHVPLLSPAGTSTFPAADPDETKDLSGNDSALAPFRDLLDTRLELRTDYRYDRAKLKPCANGQPTIFWPAKS